MTITIESHYWGDGITRFDLSELTVEQNLCLAIDAIAHVAVKTGQSPLQIARTIVETGEVDPGLEISRS